MMLISLWLYLYLLETSILKPGYDVPSLDVNRKYMLGPVETNGAGKIPEYVVRRLPTIFVPS